MCSRVDERKNFQTRKLLKRSTSFQAVNNAWSDWRFQFQEDLIHLNVVLAMRKSRWCHHDFGDKVDNRGSRLFGFQFSKYVALIIRFTGWFASDKTKATAEIFGKIERLSNERWNCIVWPTYLELIGKPVSSLRWFQRRSSGSKPQCEIVLTG